MSSLLSIVPLIIFVYIFLMLRRTPLMLASVPLFFSLGEAGFFNAYSFRIIIPFFYILSFRDTSMLLLVISLLYTSWKHPKSLIISKCSLSSFLKVCAVILALYVPLAWFTDMKLTLGTILSPRNYLYLPLSVFLWLSLFKHCHVSHLNKLFHTLLNVSFVGAILYSLSSVGLPIFPYTGWESGLGFGTITRDFLTFPPYLLIALGYILFTSNSKLQKYKIIYVFVFFLTVLLSYTRSWILAFLLSVFASLLFSRRKGVKGTLLLLFLPVILFASVSFLQHFAPNNADFLMSRFSDVTTSALPTNAESRVTGFSDIHQHISSISLFTGVGYSLTNSSSSSQLSLKGIFLEDSLWTTLLFHLGYLGVILIATMFVISLVYSFTILSSSTYASVPQFLKLSTVATIWIIARSTASNEFYWYPVINGLVLATLIFTSTYPSIVFRDTVTKHTYPQSKA